jgi:hypothetical protein
MRLMKVGVATGVLWLVASTAAHAGHPQVRRGFWVGFGFGYGSASVTCDGCGSSDRESGAAGHARLGWTLNQHVLLGGEVDVWTKEEEGVTLNLYNASLEVALYPQASSGLFVKGGIGAAYVDTELREGGVSIRADLGSGLGVVVGAGYDIRVGRNISITPTVNFWFGEPGDLELAGVPLVQGWKQNVFDISIGITFH